ncbi:hypothetical protein TRFO_37876 [Tritrichomonas foetus]|uniref:RRM domain-containing protein n=1 Tax=Tritrichomonas foetus TaxID=1144522 RepID=A0A1J4JE93_9EUKA|nr:hypothetical protein TRFO_37876 [Tritrichomonas foetus]|eukprot:OHS95979.1 hypothetical protein TRFO_37876 [Tritrichomonas foetus]
MSGKKINPWQCPPDPSQCRLLHFENLPPNCTWQTLYPYTSSFNIEHQSIFGHQALVQFIKPQQAQMFYEFYHNQLTINGYPITITYSPLTQLVFTSENPTRTVPSRVICIQVMKLRVCLGIQDIYDECSLFGIVEKIICFEKTGKFALVQMNKVEQASLALINLSNSPRHNPSFQFRIQYSKNQDIVIKFNNSKSFDFTTPDAQVQFARLREAVAGERPFFSVDDNNDIEPIFDFWRPIHFDPTFSPILGVTGFDERTITCDFLHNLFSQYGLIRRIKITTNRRRIAFIMFANCFYARLAITFMNNCPIDGKRLFVDFPPHPDISQQGDFNDQYFKDYDAENEDFDIDDYASLSFPSNFVRIKSGDITNFNLPSSAIYNPTTKVIQFASVEEAARFIGFANTAVFNGKINLVAFC